MWKTGQSYTKVIQGLKPSILFDDCPRLMIIRQYFVAWRVLISGLRVSHLDYLQLPWVCRVRDIHIWVCESDSSVLLEYIHTACEPQRSEFLAWYNNDISSTYISIGLGRLYHGYPLLTHFGYQPDSFWELHQHNGIATLASNYHLTMAYVGGMSSGREFVRDDIQTHVIDKYFKYRDRCELRPRKLLWLKYVTKVWTPNLRSISERSKVPLLSFAYEDLFVLMRDGCIEPSITTRWNYGVEETLLQAVQRIYRRDEGRIELASSFSVGHKSNPICDPWTLISPMQNGISAVDEISELAHYVNDRLYYKHGIFYKAPNLKGFHPVYLAGPNQWHITRQWFGQAVFMDL